MNQYGERYDLKPAAAWLRGYALRTGAPNIDKELLKMPLEVLTDEELSSIVALGEKTGQKLYPFKEAKTELPRVRRVLSFLHGIEFETLLEVLEHIPEVEKAVDAAVRMARQYVVVTVPSKPDDNPEHIHLLTKDILTELFTGAGCTKLHFSGVNGHLFLVAAKGESEP